VEVEQFFSAEACERDTFTQNYSPGRIQRLKNKFTHRFFSFSEEKRKSSQVQFGDQSYSFEHFLD
jgi:hypothetical protein